MKAFKVGRGPGVDIKISKGQRTVSKVHAKLLVHDDGRTLIEDLASLNGTEVLIDELWRSIGGGAVEVQLDQPLRFGRLYCTTARELLHSHPSGLEKRRPARPQLEAKKRPLSSGSGRPRIDPDTGELVFE